MKLGVVFPQTEIGADPAVVRDYVQTAEGVGYESLVIYDHVLGANPERPGGWNGPYTHQHNFHEPFVLFGYLAALTQQIELVTGVLVLPQRQTALVAKQAAEVDVLSGGRLRLGVGVGWNAVEYTALGENFNNRGQRIEEQVILLRRLWTEPLVNFEGKFHQIPDAGLKPLPNQRPIPIWFGGSADAVLRRIARIGDGWMPNSGNIENTQAKLKVLQGYLEEAGRDPQTFGLDVRVNFKQVDPQDWPGEIERWRAIGTTHLSVNTMGAGLSPQEHIATIRQLKTVING